MFTSIPLLENKNSPGKLLVFLGFSLLATLFLLMLMTAVIYSHDMQVSADKSRLRTDILMPKKEIESFKKVKRPEKPAIENQSSPQLPQAAMKLAQVNLPLPPIHAPEFATDVKMNLHGLGDADGEYLPLIKIAPVYPKRALMLGLQGYVVVQFSVQKDGSVTDPEVVESDPEGIFERAALQAVMSFKYQPRVVDGEAIVVPGVRNRFEFVLEEE